MAGDSSSAFLGHITCNVIYNTPELGQYQVDKLPSSTSYACVIQKNNLFVVPVIGFYLLPLLAPQRPHKTNIDKTNPLNYLILKYYDMLRQRSRL